MQSEPIQRTPLEVVAFAMSAAGILILTTGIVLVSPKLALIGFCLGLLGLVPFAVKQH